MTSTVRGYKAKRLFVVFRADVKNLVIIPLVIFEILVTTLVNE